MVVCVAGVESPSALLVEAAALDPAVFWREFCWLRPASGGGAVRPGDWLFQRLAIREFDLERRVICLKARQMGLSWLADAYALWLCTFNSGQTVLMLSYGEREAKEELARVEFMHARLPSVLKRPVGRPVAKDKMEFPSMDSRILSLPSTSDAGTSFTAQLVIVQELSKILTADDLMTALTPTLGTDGKLFVISTARGYDNRFARMWKASEPQLADGWVAGPDDSPFVPMFWGRDQHPERDVVWHDEKRRELGDRQFKQEYPLTPAEAFQASGDSPFADFFSRSSHHRSWVRRPEQGWPVWRGIDFGLRVAACLWGEVQGRCLLVFDELWLENRTTVQMAEGILAGDVSLGVTTMLAKAAVDPAGANRAQQTGVPDVQILSAAGIPVAVDRMGRFARVKPPDRIGLIQQLLEDDRLFVDCNRCPHLADAFERATWDDPVSGRGVTRQTYVHNEYSHVLDALGYMVINVFPPSGSTASVPVVAPIGGGFGGW